MRPGTLIVIRGLFAAVLLVATGCGSTTEIPPGGQAVQVSATATELLIDPSAVAPGDVYLVLEQSAEAVDFVHRSADGGDPRSPPLPLTDADIATIRRERTFQGAVLVGLGVGGHGNVFRIGPLIAGKYVLLHDNQLAILEVKE